MQTAGDKQTKKAFVHLGYGFGAASWRRRHTRGLIPGLNDWLPYGYYRAAGEGWSVIHSEDAAESAALRWMRRGLCRLLGFDLIHAWRNRVNLYEADVVWIHTELEGLAALLLLRLRGDRKSPKTIVQCVWLFDKWRRLPAPKRMFYRYLLAQADVITTLSTENLELARRLMPEKSSRCVLMGISTEDIRHPAARPIHRPIRLASLGSDMHRDWTTLQSAFGGKSEYSLRIASGKVPGKLFGGCGNVEIVRPAGKDEVLRLYKWADVVVVPLLPNRHASGITVVLEAAVMGVPVVVSDTGGLTLYFSDQEVRYVPVGNPDAVKTVVDRLADDDRLRHEMAVRAQERVVRSDLTSQGFARRHRRLSEAILNASHQELMRIPDVLR